MRGELESRIIKSRILEIIMTTSIAYESARIRQQPMMGTKTLWAFLGLTFGLSWVPMSLFIVFADQLTSPVRKRM
jgi:hypothetical protein